MLHTCERKGCKNKFTRKGIGQGRKKYCSKDCAYFENNRKHALLHPDYRRRYLLRYKDENLNKIMYWTAKGSASKKGFEFSINIEDIIIPEFCPVLGLKLETKRNMKTRFTSSPSLDRIDNSKGYVKGNIRVISGRANALKNNATVHELELVLADLKANSKENDV